MTTTGVSTFNLDLNDLIEEAFERCGHELRTGYDFRTARRSINLLTIEWANRGINLWTIEQGQIPININGGQISYPLPIDTIDLLDTVIRTGSGQNQTDININRISESTYSTIPNKNATGRPIQVWVDRQSGNTNASATTTLSAGISATDTTINVLHASNVASQGYINIGAETIMYQNVSGNQLMNCYRGVNNTAASAHAINSTVIITRLPNVNIWPTGVSGTEYTLIYWRMRRLNNAGDGVDTQDIPFRFIPCMVAGLAYYLSLKLQGVPADRIMGLKADYDQQFDLAAQEDREKAPIRFVPRNMSYTR